MVVTLSPVWRGGLWLLHVQCLLIIIFHLVMCGLTYTTVVFSGLLSLLAVW